MLRLATRAPGLGDPPSMRRIYRLGSGVPDRMTDARQRVLAALNRQPVDRPPVANPTNVATVELMDLVDAPFPDACRDPELAARLAAAGHYELGFDSVESVRAGKYMEVRVDEDIEATAITQVEGMCDKLLANPVIEEYRYELERVENS